MRVRSATTICVAMALAGATCLAVTWPCGVAPCPEAADGTVLQSIQGVTDTPALFSADERQPFDAELQQRGTSSNPAAALAMTTEPSLPRWFQAMGPGHSLLASGPSPLLLHCQLII